MKGFSDKKAPRPPCTFRRLAKPPLERFVHPGISKPQDLRRENHEPREETALLDASCSGESYVGSACVVKSQDLIFEKSRI